MSNEAPKLYVHKPKKAQLKKHLQQQSRSSPSPVSSSSSSSMASKPSTVASSTSSVPPTPPKESFARRYKFLWPLLLAVNFSIGGPVIRTIVFWLEAGWNTFTAFLSTLHNPLISPGSYLFMRTKKKEGIEEEVTAVNSTPTSAVSTASVIDSSMSYPAVVEPVKVVEPIPLDQQRELFKWMLEEKRKMKPKDPEEKKRIDEEKAILKQFIKAKSIPSL